MMMEDFHFPILLLGPPGEGKRNLTVNLLSSGISTDSQITMGSEIYIKKIEINGIKVRFQIWDIWDRVEEERFRKIEFPFYRKIAHAAILIFDTSIKIDKVYECIHFTREIAGDLPLMLIGNKVDVEDSHELTREKGREIAKEFNLVDYIEISTRTGDNVEKMFITIADFLIAKYD